MFTNHQPCRQAQVMLEREIERLQKQNDELVNKLMSRDFSEYTAVKEPVPEITPEDDPHMNLEDTFSLPPKEIEQALDANQ